MKSFSFELWTQVWSFLPSHFFSFLIAKNPRGETDGTIRLYGECQEIFSFYNHILPELRSFDHLARAFNPQNFNIHIFSFNFEYFLMDSMINCFSFPQFESVQKQLIVSQVKRKNERGKKVAHIEFDIYCISLELLKAIHLDGWQQWNIIKGFIMHDL